MNLFPTQTVTDVENKCMVTKGERHRKKGYIRIWGLTDTPYYI